MTLSNYAEKKILDHFLGTTSWAQESNLYIGLSTGEVTDGMSGNACEETTGDAYTREEINSWTDAGDGRVINSDSTITFPEAGTGQAWGNISWWFISETSATTDGNIIAYGSFDTAKTVAAGDDASIASGALTITVAENGMSNFCADKMLNHVFKVDGYTKPTTIYVGLTTADIADDTSGTTCNEVSGGDYARKAITWTAAASDAENALTITFVTASASWGEVTHFFLSPDLTNGDILFHGQLDAAKTIGDGDTAQFEAETLTISLE